DAAAMRRVERALAVDRHAERVHHAAEERLADGDLDDAARALDRVTLADALVRAEDGDTDVVLLEVEDHAHDPARELDELAGHGAVEAVDTGDTVTDREDGAGLHHARRLVERGDLL